MNDPKPLHSPENEKALLSSMMLSTTAARGAVEFGINDEDFFTDAHAQLFRLFVRMMLDGKPLDLVLVSNEAEKLEGTVSNWPAYVAEVFNICPSGANWRFYCQILREYATARKALQAGNRIVQAATDVSMLSQVGAISREVLQSIQDIAPRKRAVSLKDQVKAAKEVLLRTDRENCFSFGLPELDGEFSGGAHRGEMFVVAGDTGKGKSILLGMVAVAEAIGRNRPVAIYSLEMSDTDVLLRMFANALNRPMRAATTMQTEEDRRAIDYACQIFTQAPITLRSDLSDIDEICFDAATLVGMGKADVVVIDYLQIAESREGENRTQQIETISRKAKALSRRGCAVFAGSQLNDGAQVYGSRAIAHDANAVIAIESDKHGRPRLAVKKNRRGPVGAQIPVTLRGELSRFETDYRRMEAIAA